MKNHRKIALVTGSNKGIGNAIANRFESENIIVIRNGTSDFDHQNYIKADIGKRADILRLKEYVIKKYNKLDILVNNAAYTEFIPHNDLELLKDDTIDKIFNINVKGPMICTQIFRELLQQSQSGLIINIASIAGVNGKGSNIAYCASKAALINMTKSYARALAPIRVNSISPGYIQTGFVQFPDGYTEKTIIDTPLKRAGKPDDIADVALTLLKSKFITGENILVDGGLILS